MSPLLIVDGMASAHRPEMRRHEQARCEVRASAADAFDHIDCPERLSSHMSRKSWRLGGGSMSIETDAQGGRAVGSHILAGRAHAWYLARRGVCRCRAGSEPVQSVGNVGTPGCWSSAHIACPLESFLERAITPCHLRGGNGFSAVHSGICARDGASVRWLLPSQRDSSLTTTRHERT